MKILFINPAKEKFEVTPGVYIPTGAFVPPLGLLYLAKMIELQGHTATVLDCNTEGFNDVTLQQAVHSSDAVGITIYSGPLSLQNSLLIAKKVKQYAPDIPLITGGPHCSITPKQTLQEHAADIAVCGEGEGIINPLIEALEGKRLLSSIPGITYRQNNTIHTTAANHQITDLNTLPFPSRHLVEHVTYGYVYGQKLIKGKVTSLLGSRGCPHHCRFCQVSTFLPTYRARSAQNIIQEIDQIASSGYNAIAFVDDNFLAEKKKAEAIMDHIISERYDLTLWILDARVDSADQTLYEKMRKAGVTNIFFGIESGNQEVLNYYQKKITLPQIRQAVTLSKKMGFLVGGYFMIGAPIETKKHIRDTIAFAKSLPLDTVVFNHFSYPYGAQVWQEAVAQKKINPEEFLVISDNKRGLALLDSEEIDDYCVRAYRNFFFNPQYWLREAFYALYNQDPTYLKLALKMRHSKRRPVL